MANKAYVTYQVAQQWSSAVEQADDFSSLDTSLWQTFNDGSGVTSDVASGQAQINVHNVVGTAGLSAIQSFDLINHAISVELAAVSSNQDTLVGLALVSSAISSGGITSPNVRYFYDHGSGSLWGYTEQLNLGNTALEQGGYGSVYKYIRVREWLGTLYFEQSLDGQTWDAVVSTADSTTALDLSAVYPVLYGNVWASASQSSSVVGLDNFVYAASAPAVETTGVEIVSPAGELVALAGAGFPLSVIAPFSYGDSEHAIQDALAAAIRDAAGDSTLGVDFI